MVIKPTIDDIFMDRNSTKLIYVPLGMAVIFILKGICHFGQYYLMSFVGQSVIRDLREQMFAKLEEMSVGFFVRHSTGELLSRMNNDVCFGPRRNDKRHHRDMSGRY